MAIIEFPPIEAATEEGLLALGGDLEIPSLLLAYSQGIFPWPINEEFPLAWFSPDPRGIIFYEDLHISKSLKKSLNTIPYSVTVNQSFEAVIYNCASQKRADTMSGTWITQEIMDAYLAFHQAGYAHSIEIRDLNQHLIGGLYGVFLNGVFSGESMFFHTPNCSKIAFIETMRLLAKNGIYWMDTQMVTPVVGQLGGRPMPRSEYLKLLKVTQRNWKGQNPFKSP